MSDGALLPNLLLFGRVLRRAGLEVHPGRMLDAVTAVGWIGVRSRADVHSTLRALLVHRREDLPVFDEAFDAFWRAHDRSGGGLPLRPLGEPPRVVATPSAGADAGIDGIGGDTAARLAIGAYSPAGVSRTKDFAEFTGDELRRAEAIVASLGRELGTRRTRRWRRAAAGAVDLSRVARRSLRHGGEFIDLPRRRRLEKPRPVIALCDVSGSMERYSRMLLQFTFGLARSSASAESFLFATRLTRITRDLRRDAAATFPVGSARHGSGGPSIASARLTALARTVQDWGGGTRIGESLRSFNVRWARRVMRNGPIVLIVSDGWDRGDPQVLRREILRLRRRCQRLVWLNPLLGSASYEPLTRGMQAALDVVDDFLPAHNLQSLEDLARRLSAPRHAWTFRADTRSTRQ